MESNKVKKVTKVGIIGFALRVGIRSLLSGDIKIAIKRIILPVNYWRVTIFQLVANHIMASQDLSRKDTKILDIGSPKLLSLYLGSNLNGTVYATDLCDNTIFTEWKRHYKNTSNRGNLIFEYANARDLTYPDQYFDLAYSISVIHMITPAEDGDVLAIKEIQKKIRPGGSFILEIPFREKYTINYAERDNFEEKYEGQPLFKERQYDVESLKTRIEKNVEGRLIEKVFIYEKLPFDALWGRLPHVITTLLAFIEPWVDVLNIAVATKEIHYRKIKSVVMIFEIEK